MCKSPFAGLKKSDPPAWRSVTIFPKKSRPSPPSRDLWMIPKETSYDPLNAISEKLKNRVFLSILAFISLGIVYITKETSYDTLDAIFEKL